jgi:hypothetical protein
MYLFVHSSETRLSYYAYPQPRGAPLLRPPRSHPPSPSRAVVAPFVFGGSIITIGLAPLQKFPNHQHAISIFLESTHDAYGLTPHRMSRVQYGDCVVLNIGGNAKYCVAGEGFYNDTLNACPQNFPHADANVALFEITVRHTYQARHRLKAALAEHHFNLDTPKKEVLKQVDDVIHGSLSLLYREYDDEVGQNASEEKLCRGKEVCYGDIEGAAEGTARQQRRQ